MEGIEIIASRPGQISLAIVRVKDDEVLARQVEKRFGAISGIHRVSADAAQGLVSIDFEPRAMTSLSFLLQLKEAFSSLFPEISLTKLASLISRSL